MPTLIERSPMSRRTLRALLVWAALAAATLAVSGAQAAVPPLVQYQGFLTDLVGQPLDGTHDLEFALFSDSTGGALLWQEAHPGVAVLGGTFATLLGTTWPLNPGYFSGGLVWLETRVDRTPLAPRRSLASVPYALHAAEADVAGGLSSGGPMVVHTPDPRPGCPTVTPANGVLFSQSITVAAPAALSTSGHMARLGVGRVDLNLFVDGVQVQNIATNTATNDWLTGVVQWSGAVAAGTHTIELRSTPGSSWGCGANWGAIDTIVLK